MDTRPIGVFDSGLGGLTAVRSLREILPEEDLVYFGDTARVPYGGRARETLLKYARQDVRFLQTFDLKAILIACGTVSTTCLEALQAENDLPIVGVVEPTCRRALAVTKTGKTGVIATLASIRSGAYEACLRRLNPQVEVYGKPCPLFVPLVENGHIAPGDPLAVPAVEYYLRELGEKGIDTLILGCTHYPLLAPLIRAYLGDGVTLISSGQEAALTAQGLLEERGLLSDRKAGGRRHYFVTDAAGSFSSVAEVFLGEPVGDVIPVDISLLEKMELRG